MQNFKKIIVVGGLIYKKSQMLACRRSEYKDQAGLWEVPGGKVEKGESCPEALKRELQEELQISVVVQDHIATSNVQICQQKQKSLRIIMHVYACIISDIKKEEPIASSDHDDIRWISPDEIQELQWAAADVPILEAFRTFLRTKK
jgi:mutator protein MutT